MQKSEADLCSTDGGFQQLNRNITVKVVYFISFF